MDTRCVFSDPVNLGNIPAPDYEYSVQTCTSSLPDGWDKITDGTSTFYVVKNTNLADMFFISVILFLLVWALAKSIYNFFIN